MKDIILFISLSSTAIILFQIYVYGGIGEWLDFMETLSKYI